MNILVRESVDYLASDEAIRSIDIDAYWPKWNGPWWHMMVLHEMRLTEQIPNRVVEKIIDSLNSFYLPFFPFTEEEVPSGKDPLAHIACHCQLGTMDQLLTTYGINVEQRIPWIRQWYMRYQLPDGGLNCDEAAYSKPSPKSSIVSTLPPLEAVLNGTKREFTQAEIEFLDRGAEYLISKRLFRTSQGTTIDQTWLDLCFPRFYHYDVLRGLSFLLNWAVRLGRSIPLSAIEESVLHIERNFPDGIVRVKRNCWAGATTRTYDSTMGTWQRLPASSYPLLHALSELDTESRYLTLEWYQAKMSLAKLDEEFRIVKD